MPLDLHLSPFDSILAEYGPDPKFSHAHYHELVRNVGHAAALSAAADHYRTRLCQVRWLLTPDGTTSPWIDDGTRPVDDKGVSLGLVVGDPRYVGSRRQCHAFLAGDVPSPTVLDEWDAPDVA